MNEFTNPLTYLLSSQLLRSNGGTPVLKLSHCEPLFSRRRLSLPRMDRSRRGGVVRGGRLLSPVVGRPDSAEKRIPNILLNHKVTVMIQEYY